VKPTPVVPSHREVRIVAHRGWSGRYPENSLEAFTAAAALPVAGQELDVRLTADGQVVVCHDAHLGRFGGTTRPIAATPWRDLVGWRGPAGHGVPLLVDVLKRVATPFCVELKPHGGPAHTAALVQAVARLCRPQAERIHVLCFAAAPLALLARLAPELRRVRNVGRLPTDPRPLLASGVVAVDADHQSLTPTAMAVYRHAGLPVWCYTVNSQREAQRAIRLGVTTLITNHPDRLLAMPSP
jgi:glycerophosphoryl diester phosphodiesterase